MTRFARTLAALAWLAAASPALPASTTTTTLSGSAYTSLGAGPMMLGVAGCGLSWQIADARPAANATGFGMRVGDPPLAIQTSSQVWAIAQSCPAPVLAITAPITASGTAATSATVIALGLTGVVTPGGLL